MGDIALKPAELAAELRVSLVTLKRWRAKGRGPKWEGVGRAIRYRRSEIDLWRKMREFRKLK